MELRTGLPTSSSPPLSIVVRTPLSWRLRRASNSACCSMVTRDSRRAPASFSKPMNVSKRPCPRRSSSTAALIGLQNNAE